MKKFFINILAVITLFLILPTVVSAHQPNYEDSNTLIDIKNPDISQAFYGELGGQPVVYKIYTIQPLNLYVGLLVPDLADSRTDFVLDIFDSKNNQIYKLAGGNWKKYFEEFARDDYLKGPDYKTEIPAGNYKLVLSNPQNQGKYVLVVGEKESFPLQKIPRIFDQLIKVKVNTFDKPWYSAFLNIFGAAILGIVLIIALILFILKWILLKKKKG